MAKIYIYEAKSKTPSATANRSLPSFCFGFIALTPNSDKSWSFPARAKLAKLSRLLNRLSQKESSISHFSYEYSCHAFCITFATYLSLYVFCSQSEWFRRGRKKKRIIVTYMKKDSIFNQSGRLSPRDSILSLFSTRPTPFFLSGAPKYLEFLPVKYVYTHSAVESTDPQNSLSPDISAPHATMLLFQAPPAPDRHLR